MIMVVSFHVHVGMNFVFLSTAVQDKMLIKAEIEGLARAVKSQGLVSIDATEASNNSGIKTKDSPEKKNENNPDKVCTNGCQVSSEGKRTLQGSHGSVVELTP